jgi:hypothetical protein
MQTARAAVTMAAAAAAAMYKHLPRVTNMAATPQAESALLQLHPAPCISQQPKCINQTEPTKTERAPATSRMQVALQGLQHQ